MTDIVTTESIKFGAFTIGGIKQTIATGNAIHTWEQDVPANTTNRTVTLPIALASIKAIAVSSDAAGTVIKTNSTSAPDETLTLQPNFPLIWNANKPSSMRFITHNVSVFYVTTTNAAHVKIAADADVVS